MGGERDLDVLLATLRPRRRPGRFVFVTVPDDADRGSAVAWVREDEGTTLVLRQSDADRRGLGYDVVTAMITLGAHSALDAVGLTAAVAGALAAEGIACNVVAGYHHDHLFVPADRAEEALELLEALSVRSS